MTTTGAQPLEKEDLRQTIADVLDLDVENVTDDALFIEELGVDSLMSLEVLVVLERKYGIKLDESRLKSITSLRRAYDIVAERLEA